MVVPSAQLLKHLEPAVRPGIAPASPGVPRAGFDKGGFEELLKLAAAGGVRSGRQIEVGIDLHNPPSPSQLERMAAAADQAEAAGYRRALLLIDGRGFVVDVASRSILAELSEHNDARAHQVDGAIFVASSDDVNVASLEHPGAGLRPEELLQQLNIITPHKIAASSR